MFTKVTSFLSRFRRDEEGVTLVEYGVAIVLAIAVGTGALITLSGQINTNMTSATTAMTPPTN